jgi:hypothetical protein
VSEHAEEVGFFAHNLLVVFVAGDDVRPRRLRGSLIYTVKAYGCGSVPLLFYGHLYNALSRVELEKIKLTTPFSKFSKKIFTNYIFNGLNIDLR